MTEPIKEEIKETPAPQPEGDKTPENKEVEEAPKLPDSDQVKSLSAQKEHQRAKREEAEAEVERLKAENAELIKNNSTPSDEELSNKYPDYDLLDDQEKAKIKREEEREKRLRKLEEENAWIKDYGSLIKQDEFASLKEREEEFKDFAYKYPKSIDLPTLAKAFLYSGAEAPTPETEPRPGVEKPTAGDAKVAPKGMSLADIERLRTTDPKKYIEMIRKGLMKDIPKK